MRMKDTVQACGSAVTVGADVRHGQAIWLVYDVDRMSSSCRCTRDRRWVVPRSHDQRVLDASGAELDCVWYCLQAVDNWLLWDVHRSSGQRD